MTQLTSEVPVKTVKTLDTIISDPKLARALFFHLSDKELCNCALVKKLWHHAVVKTRERRTFEVSYELLQKLQAKNKKIADHIKLFRYSTDIIIHGWSQGEYIPRDFYDHLINFRLRAKTLTLRGRGNWDTCQCPNKVSSACGEQFDTTQEEDLTNLESVYIDSAFRISSCALLDLISRSPNLKVLRVFGIICKTDHNISFASKRFYSDIERIYWPWPKKKQFATLATIVKRNENITTFQSNAETTCELLSNDSLPNMRFLSIYLSEDWSVKNSNSSSSIRFAFKYIQNIKYLSLAKKVEALEVRTFDYEVKPEVERAYEEYRLAFWQQVAKMNSLKYLSICGVWEFEEVCQTMVRLPLQIEYLKINLMPKSILDDMSQEKEVYILSIANGLKSLRKLAQLRSLHYICSEKLVDIDRETISAFKELMDKIWILDIKVHFTNVIEDLLMSAMKRGNQLGKLYSIRLHITPEDTSGDHCNLLVNQKLKFSTSNTSLFSLRTKLTSIAESESAIGFGSSSHFGDFHIWGLEQKDNIRDRKNHDLLKTNWNLYNEKFYLNPAFF